MYENMPYNIQASDGNRVIKNPVRSHSTSFLKLFSCQFCKAPVSNYGNFFISEKSKGNLVWLK